MDLCKDHDRVTELSKVSLKRNTLISYTENTSLTRKILYMQWKKSDNELNQKEESLIDTITE